MNTNKEVIKGCLGVLFWGVIALSAAIMVVYPIKHLIETKF